jgi:hypothetical protein
MKRGVLAREARCLALPHLVERLAKVVQDVELVEEDAHLRRVGVGGGAKRVITASRIRALFLASSHVKNAFMLASERSVPAPATEITDDDSMGVYFPATARRCRLPSAGGSCAPQLLAHVLLLEGP